MGRYDPALDHERAKGYIYNLQSPGRRWTCFKEVDKVFHSSNRKCGAFEIKSEDRVFVETDGEIVGFLPARYRIYPGKLRVII